MADEQQGSLKTGLTREQAYALLKEYNQDPFHISHAETLAWLTRKAEGMEKL